MFDFLIRGFAVKSAQRYINKLNPQVNVHIPPDLPLPSIRTIKRMCATVAQINGLEPELSRLTDDQLKNKTQEFKLKYQESIKEKKTQRDELEEQYRAATSSTERESVGLQITRIHLHHRLNRLPSLWWPMQIFWGMKLILNVQDSMVISHRE